MTDKTTAPVYSLAVKFTSNEHPWSTIEKPMARHQPRDDEAAIAWAKRMADGMGREYSVTLLKDGTAVGATDD